MRLPVLSITDVAHAQLCCGCGACAYVAPRAIEMVTDFSQGRRPVVNSCAARAGELTAAMRVCPGAALSHGTPKPKANHIADLFDNWGPVLGVWEGFASDEQIRSAGSSGGAASALALFAIEQKGWAGVLHTAARTDAPFLNETVMSQTRDELLARTGSRYAPASPCDGLARVEQASGPCVFIGKPCDVAAVQRARAERPELDAKVGLTIAFFCAGTPSTEGTLELLRNIGVEDPASVTSLRYRGNGWPGRWTVRFKASNGEQERSLSYEESWSFLQRYRQWRCYICPDHTGEFADVAVGDPWYRRIEPGEAGKSLIVARTERGREMIAAAASAGYLTLEREDPRLLPASQPNLLQTRGAIWGRVAALRLSGGAVPRFGGFRLFRLWMTELTIRQKGQSFWGTFQRVRRKGLNRPRAVRLERSTEQQRIKGP